MSSNVTSVEEKYAGTTEGQGCGQPGTFCWNELLAADTGRAARFYTQLFGWQTEEMQLDQKYTLFKHEGRPVGGMMARPNEQAPAQWLGYVLVQSVDASANKAVSLGAKLLLPPMDVPTVGRVAVFMDPQGVPLGLFQPAHK